MQYDIFISYSRWDFSYAKDQIESISKALGLKCFYDIELGMGEEFTSQITEAISNSKLVLLFYSHDLEKATWNKHELNYASSLGKPFVLVNLENDEPRGWYATHFKQKYISYDDGEGISNIVDAVKEAIGISDLINSRLAYRGSDDGEESEINISCTTTTNSRGNNRFQREPERVDTSYSAPKPQLEPYQKPPRPSFLSRLFRSKRDKVKIKTCEIKFFATKPCSIYIDGLLFASVKQDEFCRKTLENGEYIVKYVSHDNRQYSEIIKTEDVNTKAIIIKFTEKQVVASALGKTIQCFIAGSTGLKQERRSFCYVMSRLHNQWRNRRFSIESYSYEDFSRSVQKDGQQNQYNEFIQSKADIIMFVFDTNVGDVTLEELNLAISVYRKTHRPKIYVYSKHQQIENEQLKLLRDRMDKLNQYWVDYKDLYDLETQFEHDMNWYLFDFYNEKDRIIGKDIDNLPF